jgi:hypothetical protein
MTSFLLGHNSCFLSSLENAKFDTLIVAFLQLTVYQVRQLSGCLIRVPRNFYEDIWYILKKTPGGIYFNDQHLPQEPTLSKMSR